MNINIDGIPDELKTYKQWVCWDLKTIRDKNAKIKETKIPKIAGTKENASTNDPSTWGTFDQAIKAVNGDLNTGIGFVFTKSDPFCFVDLDKCIDPETKKINQWALDIIKRLNSYTEISQSGLGIHIIVKAKLPEWSGNRKGNFEIYDSGRYCAMTGNVLRGLANGH